MINYNYWLDRYAWNDGANVYINNNLVEFSNFNGTPRECETEIARLINNITIENIDRENDNILRIIDLINQWGGQTSRMFYSRHARNNFQSPRDRISNIDSLNTYKSGALQAMRADEIAFNTFSEIYGISDSFSGKHAMFWSNFNLIIIDNKIAGALGYKSPSLLLNNINYQDILANFRTIQSDLNLTNPTMVERALFSFHSNYFKNDNSGFKNNIEDFTDREYALEIGRILELDTPDYF